MIKKGTNEWLKKKRKPYIKHSIRVDRVLQRFNIPLLPYMTLHEVNSVVRIDKKRTR